MYPMSHQSKELQVPFGDAISQVQFARNSNNLLISSWDCTLRLFDVDEDVVRWEARANDEMLLGCCFASDTVALTAGSGGCIHRYNLSSGEHDVIGRHDDAITCIKYSEIGIVITSSLDNKVMLWDTRMGSASTICLKCLDLYVTSFTSSSTNLLAAVGNVVYIYDLRQIGEPVQLQDFSMKNNIKCVSSSPSMEGFVAGSVDGSVAVKYDDHTKDSMLGCVFRCRPKVKHGTPHIVCINDVELHPSCDTFATGDNEGYTIAWNAKSREKLFEVPRYPNSVVSLSYNHDGQFLAVASSRTYQEANEVDYSPKVFIERMGGVAKPSCSSS